jgi:nitroreductase
LFAVHAPYYIAFFSNEAPKYLMNSGYMIQQMSLYLTTIGLGSCIIGSTRIRKEYQKRNGKRLIALMAFGKAKGAITRQKNEARRCRMEELCVCKEAPGKWTRQILEAGRMAPSAMNLQPWRFVVLKEKIHIFSRKHLTNNLNRFDELNFGILFANMTITAEELWVDMDLIRLENLSQKEYPNNHYVLSAIIKNPT